MQTSNNSWCAMTKPAIPQEQFRLTEASRPCSYLANEEAALEYRLIGAATPDEVQWLMERGWRRFGVQFFRPACPQCSKCVSIRVDVNRFHPSKGHRRTLKRNSHISVTMCKPTVSELHVDLYNRWHEDMTERRGWTPQAVNEREYWESFLIGRFESLREMRYFDGDRLVGIGLVELLPAGISSSYFYHDPDWRESAPGTFSLLCEIELARSLEKPWLYLGYWIKECPSMAYKNRFQPAEVLSRLPADTEQAEWRAYKTKFAASGS